MMMKTLFVVVLAVIGYSSAVEFNAGEFFTEKLVALLKVQDNADQCGQCQALATQVQAFEQNTEVKAFVKLAIVEYCSSLNLKPLEKIMCEFTVSGMVPKVMNKVQNEILGEFCTVTTCNKDNIKKFSICGI